MESDPQGKPIDKWVEEVGESECYPVMGGIRVLISQQIKEVHGFPPVFGDASCFTWKKLWLHS